MAGCHEIRQLAAADIDGTATPAEGARLQAHLAACASCRQWGAAQREVRGWLAARPAAEAPPGFVQRVQRRVHDAEKRAQWTGWMDVADWRRWTEVALPVAAGLFAAALLTGSGATMPQAAGESAAQTRQAIEALTGTGSEADTRSASWWRSDMSDEDVMASMLGTSTTGEAKEGTRGQ